MFCTQCGHQNPDDSRFCARCGAAVARPAPERSVESTSTISLGAIDNALEADPGQAEEPAEVGASAGDALAPGTGLLVVKRGPNAGSRFLLDEVVTTAGRHPESDIFLDDVTVSRRHAEFIRRGKDFLVRDVGSLNGTYLNRGRIDSAVLAGGDEVQIGKYRLVFLTSSGAGDA